MTVRIHHKPCDDCGCYLIDDFECGCGAVHEPYCKFCGRFVGASTPVEADRPPFACTHGPTAHHHTEDEKTAYQVYRLEKMQERMKQNPRRDDETIEAYIQRMQTLRTSTVAIN